jgi:hypothetical protein
MILLDMWSVGIVFAYMLSFEMPFFSKEWHQEVRRE